MKKLVLVFGAMFALSLFSCVEGNGTADEQTTFADTIDTVDVDGQMAMTGVAIDGAMNSVYLKVGDDTIEFSYPDLDSDHRASWEINDTLTVRYYVTENGDSVTEVVNESEA